MNIERNLFLFQFRRIDGAIHRFRLFLQRDVKIFNRFVFIIIIASLTYRISSRLRCN